MEIKEGKLARVEPSDRKGTQEHSPEAPEGPETRREEARKHEDQGRTKKDGQEKRDRSNNSHNRQRRLGPKGGPRHEGTEIRPSYEGG